MVSTWLAYVLTFQGHLDQALSMRQVALDEASAAASLHVAHSLLALQPPFQSCLETMKIPVKRLKRLGHWPASTNSSPSEAQA